MANTEKIDGVSTTLAHELVAREEHNVGIFIAAFAIQYYFSKEMVKHSLVTPKFLMNYGATDIYASQRVFIKNIIRHPDYKQIINKLYNILIEYNSSPKQLPQELLLAKINKAFVIRQIFKQTDQVLPRYDFMDEFVDKNIADLDMDLLYDAMSALPLEQQILVLARIYAHLTDQFEDKKRSINTSFLENIRRWLSDAKARNKQETREYKMFEQISNVLEHWT